jgi:hypothetical protein
LSLGIQGCDHNCPEAGLFGLLEDFHKEEMPVDSNYTDPPGSRDQRTITRSCTPQLAMHQHGALGIQVGRHLSELPEHSRAAYAAFLVAIKSNDYKKAKQSNRCEDDDEKEEFHQTTRGNPPIEDCLLIESGIIRL